MYNRRVRRSFLLALLLVACPREHKPKPAETCTKVGESCTYAPGKLGVCIESVNGNPPLICQSQH
jgi:hypothetical protein